MNGQIAADRAMRGALCAVWYYKKRVIAIFLKIIMCRANTQANFLWFSSSKRIYHLELPLKRLLLFRYFRPALIDSFTAEANYYPVMWYMLYSKNDHQTCFRTFLSEGYVKCKLSIHFMWLSWSFVRRNVVGCYVRVHYWHYAVAQFLSMPGNWYFNERGRNVQDLSMFAQIAKYWNWSILNNAVDHQRQHTSTAT